MVQKRQSVRRYSDESGLRKRVAERIFSGVYAMNKFVKEAPVLVAAVSEKEKFLASFGGQIRDTSYCLLDIGIDLGYSAEDKVAPGQGNP